MIFCREIRKIRNELEHTGHVDPMSVPCIETSDSERLCKEPVVSIHMITYNHEPYIRKAIEGVVMQQADFEFELVIGEDCSTDKTREICFEYQRRYPDKIRVLWWHENVSKLGGNFRRVSARCRGEFMALCEGDDYWTDCHKLQKQVEALRRYPQASLCSHRYIHLIKDELQDCQSRQIVSKLGDEMLLSSEFLVSGDQFFCPSMLSQTATLMYRRSMFDNDLYEKIPRRCDWVLCYVLLRNHSCVFLNEAMSVYRVAETGMWWRMTPVERSRWSVAMAMGVYQVDPTPLSKKRYDYCMAGLRAHCIPYKQCNFVYYIVRRKIGQLLRNLKLRN